jgi:CO dehydrogenase/acetyl-CoA synthase epsilon subunit
VTDGPVYAIDLSSGKRIDLQTMTVVELKQFAKDNFNKGYDDLNRAQLILLNGASAIDIKEQARQQGIKNYSKMRKSELIKILTTTKK